MAMRWRVTANEWRPDQLTLLDRDGAKDVDRQENRRRLNAYELNAQVGARGCWHLFNELLPEMERQAKHVGMWWRLKGCIAQLAKIQAEMLNHVAIEQVLSVKNNTQHMRICLIPEGMPNEPEMLNLPLKEHNRLLCASLSYCEMHCDGSQLCQRGCRIKKMLDESCYIQDCDFPQLVPGQCKYAMADVAWDEIAKG